MKKHRPPPPKSPRTLDETARERIVKWRRNAGMTQKELGDLCGRNAVWISRYENRYFDSDLDTLARMCAAFNQTIFAALNVQQDPTEQQLIECYRSIPRPAARTMALDLLRELSGGAGAALRAPAEPPSRPTATTVASRRGGRTVQSV